MAKDGMPGEIERGEGAHVSERTPPALQLTMEDSGEHFVLLTSSRSGDGLFRFRWTLGPGKKGPPPHMHEHETETFSVVSGTLHIWISGELRALHAGDTVAVPPRAPHRFLNPGPEPVVVNVSLDGPRQEDNLVPLAILQMNGENISGGMLMKHTIAQLALGAIGAHPRGAQLVLRGLARMLMRLGLRALPSVPRWDAAGVTIADLRSQMSSSA